MRKYKSIIKVILFISLFSVIFLWINQVVGLRQLERPWDMTNKINGLRNEPKNHFDVMYFGSSHMYSSINPTLIWEETGIPSYAFATRQQPFWVTYHYMKEALKYQKPKVMVLDILMAKQQEDYSEEAVNRTAIDLLPFSFNRFEMIRASVPKEERPSYYIPFIKYHSRWKEIEEKDYDLAYLDNTDPLKGFVMLHKYQPIADREVVEEVEAVQPLSEKTYKYLYKIIDLAKKEGIQLMFYKAPSNATKEEMAYFNTVKAIAQEEGIPYIDYNKLYEVIGLDTATDFYDRGHVTYIGAEKVTRHFAKVLQETFKLPSRKGEASYDDWEKCVAYYERCKEEMPLIPVE